MILAASNIASSVNEVFFYIVSLSVVLFVGIIGVMLFFVFKYSRKKNKTPANIHGNIWLEITWTVIPTILVLSMFYVGYLGFDLMRTVPKDAFEVNVTGRMWSWSFKYPNGYESDSLVVPKDRAIKTVIHSMDVLHSFFIPAFRIKEDAVPGKATYMWFIPTEIGEFDIECAEYCGMRHSYMLTKVKVVAPEAFDKWYAEVGAGVAVKVESKAVDKAGESDLAKKGMLLTKNKGCIACHTADGSKLVGPSYKGLFGSKATVVTNGAEREVVVDEDYLIRSIKEPNADVVKGYAPIMPPQPLTDDEIKMIIDYIKGLK